MFVGNEFKEDPSSEINPMKAFGTDELEEVWNGLADSLNRFGSRYPFIRDFQLTIWYKDKSKVRGSSFFYEVDELDEAYEKIYKWIDDGAKILKIELTPRIKSTFIDIQVDNKENI